MKFIVETSIDASDKISVEYFQIIMETVFGQCKGELHPRLAGVTTPIGVNECPRELYYLDDCNDELVDFGPKPCDLISIERVY